MAEIFDFSTQEKITKEDIHQLSSLMGELSGKEDTLEAIGGLLNLPEDKFALLAPGILDSYLRGLNNANTRLLLAQAINANGIAVEDMVQNFAQLGQKIDTLESFSAQKKDFLKQLVNGLGNCISETQGVAKKYIQIPYEKCREGARMPEYAHIDDSGMDLYALEDYTIHPGETKLIPTGLKFAIPNGYELQIRPKSGRCLKTKLRVANTPATIDAGFRGEVCVIVENVEAPIQDITYEFDNDGHPVITSILHGADHYIHKGEKFAQLVLAEVPKANFYLVDKVMEDTERADGGFGSTGLK